MKKYYRITLGKKARCKIECYGGSFIGCNFEIREDLNKYLKHNDKETFIQNFRETYLKYNNGAKENLISSECRQIWVICKDIKEDDIVICPNGKGLYYIGKIVSGYYFIDGNIELRHRRKVEWYDKKIEREKMSDELKKITKSYDTVIEVTEYANEIKEYLNGESKPKDSNEDSKKKDINTNQYFFPNDKLLIITKAFMIILPELANYIGKILLDNNESNWWQVFVKKIKDNTIMNLPENGSYEECVESLDILCCLKIIINNWHEIFNKKLGKRHLTWAHELIDIRNEESHFTMKKLKSITNGDIDRALDTIERFIRPINHDVTDQISKMRKGFGNQYKNE
jgi:hypothetical protein